MRVSSSSIISQNIRIRYPEGFSVGDHSIVDDFCYFSTHVEIGNYCHIAPSCTVAGGKDHLFKIGDFSSLSSGVRIYCTSNDFVNGLVCLLTEVTKDIEENIISGNVILEKYSGVGANTVIMPNNFIPEGATIGASSFVPENFDFQPWGVYAGNPLRKVKDRNKGRILDTIEKIQRKLEII